MDGPSWLAMSPLHYLLGNLHYAQHDAPPLHHKIFPLGTAVSRRARGDHGKQGFHQPPSVERALCNLTVSQAYEAGLPFVRFGEPGSPYDIVGVTLNDMRGIVNVDPPALIPISGARHESLQLRYNRPGAPKCASGCECVGAVLPGALGPLCVYQTPAEAAANVYPPAPAFCLLCIRTDAAALAKTLSTIVESARAGLGKAAMAIAPFQNLVNTADGYKEMYLGVSPINSRVFTPISIVGPCDDLQVEYDEAMGGLYVDQSVLVYGAHVPQSN